MGEKAMLQLSSLLKRGAFEGMTVEAAIQKNPLQVQELVESGQLKLAVGALRYLREEVSEWLSCWPVGGVDPQNFY